MKETKTVYKCDRCGKEFKDIYCHMDVHLPYDLSICGAEYYFCKKCYKEIHNVMTNKDQKYYTKEIVYYPIYSPNWNTKEIVYYPTYPFNQGWQWYPTKVTYTSSTNGISINGKDVVSKDNIITTKINDVNDITANVRRN